MAQVVIVDTLGMVGIGIVLFVLIYVLLRLLTQRSGPQYKGYNTSGE